MKDLALLWLWCRPVDTAPILPLVSICLRSSPEKKKKKKIKEGPNTISIIIKELLGEVMNNNNKYKMKEEGEKLI